MPHAQIAEKYGSFFHLARQHQVIFYCMGYFSQNIVAGMAEAVKLQLEVAGVAGPTRRKLFSAFIEMAQNIIHYSADALTPPRQNDGELRHGAVCIRREDDGSLVPPDRFIPMAEHSGLIVPLGQWVLTTACRSMRELLDAGCAPLRMAVNVSTVQLKDPGFLQTAHHALSQQGLQGAQLELEITESVAVLPTQLLQSTLNALRALGVTMAIDDFGTGYSSLSYLERLPLDRIKIDRSFVRQLGESQEARIAEMVAQLGRKLGLQVLAEGIEDAAAWQALRAMGCHEGQGYHIAMPMDKDRLLEWLRQHRSD